MGDRVWIKVVAANLEKRQLDYQWLIDGNGEEKTQKKRLEKKEKKEKNKSR
jgi:ribonuclease R